MPTPTRTSRSERGIAMLGATGSGKSTFLGALQIAFLRRAQQDPDQPWRLWSRDKASREALVEMDIALNSKGEFPFATQRIDNFDWILDGTVERTERSGRLGVSRKVDERVEVTMKLTDPSGELYRPDQMGQQARQELVEHVARSRGILYMFDPIREYLNGDAYENTANMLMEVNAEVADDPDFDGRLPHHVAVCVTKLDEPRVFRTAQSLRLLVPDPYHPLGFPMVHGTDARTLLQSLCQVGRSGAGEVLPQLLETYFHPDRISYYATSAVGFMVSKRTRRFDPQDTENVYRIASGETLVRGPVNPVNVSEPVTWLVERLMAAPRPVRA
jgi:hypothetical protein